MRKWLHKKFLPLVLTLVFSVAGFGSFASMASATIASELEANLNLPQNILDLRVLDAVAEIPSDLLPADRNQVLQKIGTDPAVKSALDEALTLSNKLSAAQNAYDSAKATAEFSLSFGVCRISTDPLCVEAVAKNPTVVSALAAIQPLEDALVPVASKLRDALVAARNNQDSSILLLQKEGQLANQVNLFGSILTSKKDDVSEGFNQQGQADIIQQQAGGVTLSADDMAAKKAERNQAKELNLSDDEVVVKMQDACDIFSANGLISCAAVIIYKVVYTPTAYVLMFSGMIFDKILSLSTDSAFVNQGFINSSWTVVRDFSNMLFIFVLLYTGIMTMFGAADWRKVVLQVVVIALLINFSLFFTKVIIDAGNVLAVGILSSISPGNSISESLAGSFQPQQFLKTATLGDDTTGADAIVVFLVATVVSGFAAYVFFKVALLFMGRLMAFWFLMIVSPFALISMTLPKGNKFQEWLDTLLSQAFVAPVFLFFVYLIMMVIQAGQGGILGSFSNFGEEAGWFKALLAPIIVATLLCVALMKALEFAGSMAGDFGKMGADMAGKAMGMTSAGAAMTGGATIRAMSALGGKLEGRAGALGAIGRGAAQVGHAGRDFTFDARNIPIPFTGATVGSLTGAGAGRTQNLRTTRAEAVKHAEEEAKRAAEKPESVAQAVAKAEVKRREQEETKAKRTPELEKRIAKLNTSMATLSANNGGATGDTLVQNLEATLRMAEANTRVMEGQAVRDPSDGQAQVNFLRSKRDKETAEKDFKKASSASEDLEKMQKQLEEYKK